MSHTFLRRLACSLFISCIPFALMATDTAPATTHKFSQPFIDAAKKAQPSVVSIRVKLKKGNLRAGQRGEEEVGPEDFWEHFFGGSPFEQRPRQAQPRYASGSGFIVSKDGYLLTNNHNVEDAETIAVQLADGKEYTPKVIGTDPSTDIALLKIDATDLPTLLLADSSKVEVGEWVLAIGNQVGLFQGSVSAGIISAKGRSDLELVRIESFLQTDAAINPGNSGGPLVNLNGEVVGMNTAIASMSGGSIGIGFAVPSDFLHSVMDELIKHGKLTRGWLGVLLQRVDSDIATAVGLERPYGALVSEVAPESPAEKGGLQSGDIILEVQDKTIENAGALRNLVAFMKPGETVTMKVRRSGKEVSLSITIGEMPDARLQNSSMIRDLGFLVEPVTPELAKKHNLETKTGLLVAEVDPESLSYQAGLRPGYVILAVNGKSVATIDEFSNALTSAEKGGRVLLQVKIGTNIRFIAISVE